jgi:hypothetical protein
MQTRSRWRRRACSQHGLQLGPAAAGFDLLEAVVELDDRAAAPIAQAARHDVQVDDDGALHLHEARAVQPPAVHQGASLSSSVDGTGASCDRNDCFAAAIAAQ